jgi:hypothetical protein
MRQIAEFFVWHFGMALFRPRSGRSSNVLLVPNCHQIVIQNENYQRRQRNRQSLRVLVRRDHVASFRYRSAALFFLDAAFPFPAAIFQKLRAKRREYDCAVVANGFDRATFHRFFAEHFLLRGLWLLVNVGMTPVVVALETGWCRFAAQIAVDALIIDVKCPRYVFGVFVYDVGHSFYGKSEVQN